MDVPAIALDLLLPRRCLLCDTAGIPGMLCPPCHADLPWLVNACTRCALPLPGTIELCGRCLGKPPAFDASIAAFHYASPVDRLIGQFKNQRRLSAGRLLSGLLHDRLKARSVPLPDVISPVPLHWRRQVARGFNQAAFIAGHLGLAFNVPLVRLGKRNQPTPKQQQLDRKQRLRNLRDAFTITTNLTGRHVAVVDDVVTTGATAQALSAALKDAGASRVEVWAIARTPQPT